MTSHVLVITTDVSLRGTVTVNNPIYRPQNNENNRLTHLGEMPGVGGRFARVGGFSPT